MGNRCTRTKPRPAAHPEQTTKLDKHTQTSEDDIANVTVGGISKMKYMEMKWQYDRAHLRKDWAKVNRLAPAMQAAERELRAH